LKIDRAEFIKSCLVPNDYPATSFPEIAFAGRSNVGKSSLINHLVYRKSMARSSATPGKTQTLNFYAINQCLMFVDLPGYGYSKAPETANAVWRKAIDLYFTQRDLLKGVILLVDIRHPTLPVDFRVSQWLQDRELLLCCIAAKADKISRSQQSLNCEKYRKDLMLSENVPLIKYSIKNAEGRDDVWRLIQAALKKGFAPDSD
jgi:GTP-binding protein